MKKIDIDVLPPGPPGFVVQSFSEIRDVICPIFIQFLLLTSKRLDFQDFYKAVLIKNKNSLSKTAKYKLIFLPT